MQIRNGWRLSSSPLASGTPSLIFRALITSRSDDKRSLLISD